MSSLVTTVIAAGALPRGSAVFETDVTSIAISSSTVSLLSSTTDGGAFVICAESGLELRMTAQSASACGSGETVRRRAAVVAGDAAGRERA
jgi:hypothetical protein